MSTWTRPPPDGPPARRWPLLAGAVALAAIVIALTIAAAMHPGHHVPGHPDPVQTSRISPPREQQMTTP